MTTDKIRATLDRIKEGVAIEKRNIARMEARDIEIQRRFRAFVAETENRLEIASRINSAAR